MKKLLRISGAFLKLIGYGLMVLSLMGALVWVLIAIYHPRITGTSFLQVVPQVLLFWGVAQFGRFLERQGAVESTSGVSDAPAPGRAEGIAGTMGTAAAGFGLIFVLAIVMTAVSCTGRSMGHGKDRRRLGVGIPAEDALAAVAHADRVDVSWRPGEVDRMAPKKVYRYRRNAVERPMTTAGTPLGLASCEAEYRIIGTFRRYISLTFDADGKVSGIQDSTLD